LTANTKKGLIRNSGIEFVFTFQPMIIIFVVQAAVSLKRINRFMNSEEIDPDAVTHDENESRRNEFT
jgi:hypothetical protein